MITKATIIVDVGLYIEASITHRAPARVEDRLARVSTERGQVIIPISVLSRRGKHVGLIGLETIGVAKAPVLEGDKRLEAKPLGDEVQLLGVVDISNHCALESILIA